MKRAIGAALAVVTGCFLLSGCGGSKASESKPIAEVQAEASKMTVKDLESVVKSYKETIAAKQKDLQALQEKIKAIPITQLLGTEAKAIKDDVSKIAGSVQALTERMTVYVKELKAKAEAKK
jgi:hypothetical protein